MFDHIIDKPNMIEIKLDIERDNFKLPINLMIEGRGITTLFGPSGIGKTSILRAIAGLDKYRNSDIRVGGNVWQDQHNFMPTHHRKIAYVFQEASLFGHLNVKENLQFGVKRFVGAKAVYSLEELIEMMGLRHLLERKPAHLSGGERQRVAIARALAISPCLLLMDEPLSSLDYASKQEILPYIETLHQRLDIPIIYVSHSLEEVARVSDDLILLNSKGVQASGPIDQMLTRLDLPLAHYDDAASIIEAQVIAYEEPFKLSHLEFSGGKFSILKSDIRIGSKVRVRVAASDVSLTLDKQTDTSILNIFKATIDQISVDGNAQAMVRLKVGKQMMLSRVTNKSVFALALHEGQQVYAQAKSIAVLA